MGIIASSPPSDIFNSTFEFDLIPFSKEILVRAFFSTPPLLSTVVIFLVDLLIVEFEVDGVVFIVDFVDTIPVAVVDVDAWCFHTAASCFHFSTS